MPTMRLLPFTARAALMLALLAATAARADYPEAVRNHILPAAAAFRTAAADLAQVAAGSCRTEDLAPGFNATFDAWLGLQFLRLGAAEKEGLNAAVEFWPDPKGLGLKAQKAMLAGDPATLSAATLADQSVAARGLGGLERLLWPKEPLAGDTCALIAATATDLADVAGLIAASWQTEADLMLAAGADGNLAYLSGKEVRQTLYTQIQAALEGLSDTRIGRPLGSFDKPRPDLAESRASGRTLRNIRLTLETLRAVTVKLTPDVPQTLAAYDRALALVAAMPDPTLADIATPEGRLKLEILQQAVDAIRAAGGQELAAEMDVSLGFNAADGD